MMRRLQKLTILWGLMLQLQLLIFRAAGIRYDLIPGTTIYNLKNLTTILMSNGSGFYRILNNGTESFDLISNNGTFALSFFDPDNTGNFYLAVMMQSAISSKNLSAVAAVPVWIANANESCSDGSRLMFTQASRKFILLDSRDGSKLWDSQTVNVTGIQLDETGNLAFYNDSGKIIWQSFDYPGDTLASKQTLRTGQKLTCTTKNASADSHFRRGIFTAEVLRAGMQLAVGSEPYGAWSLATGGIADVESASKGCDDQNAVLGFTDSGLLLSCGISKSPLQILSNNKNSPLSLPFARLNADGNLLVYSFDSSIGDWIEASSFSGEDSCKLPLTCGPYGICQSGGLCICPQNLGKGNQSYGVAKKSACSLTPTQGIPLTEQCENEFYNHHFLNRTAVGYFSSRFAAPGKKGSLDSCSIDCLSNCSCMALFYNDQSQECFFVVNSVIGSLRADPQMRALIKFQNANITLGPITQGSEVSKSKSKSNLVQIITGVSASAILLLLLGLILFMVYRNKKKKRSGLEIEAVLSSVRGLPQRFTHSSLEAATKGFSRKLGTGGFGSVYEGFLSDRRHVAVKKLEGNGTQGARQFVAEVATIGSISHVNVVRLCGFCLEGDHRMLVYEFMPNGSLDKWLFSSSSSSNDSSSEFGDGNRTPNARGLSWERRIEIALGTARGLAYLHEECSEPIIHLDVKPQNILLDERFVAKVADFGMSKLLDDHDVSQVYTCVRGTPGYLAPEWLMHSVATKKCDVYSFGMVLLEIIGGRKNLEVSRMNKSDLAWYFPAWVVNEARLGNLMGVVDEKIRAGTSEKQATRMIHIALWCIQENAGLRPAMDEVVQMIEGRRDVEEPPLSFHFAVQTQAIVDITASRDSVSMASLFSAGGMIMNDHDHDHDHGSS